MKQNIETLKEYFETGDKPSQQNYADLIDSLGMPMIGEIKQVSFGFAPAGWVKCNGQLFDPTTYPELFALIGTTFGGDGTTTFAVPDMGGRVPVGYGSPAGLSSYTIGQTGGEESITLTEAQLPAHSHTGTITDLQGSMPASTGTGSSFVPGSSLYPSSSATIGAPIYGGTSDTSLGVNVSSSGLSIDATGQDTPVNNLQPYLAVNYIIAVEGINPV